MTDKYLKLVHFFGEMDLNLSKNADEIYKKAFHISESCGYFVDYIRAENNIKIALYGHENEKIFLIFDLLGNFLKIVDYTIYFACLKEQLNKDKMDPDRERVQGEYTLNNLPGQGCGYLGYFY